MELEDELDGLYAKPPAAFVAARNELARCLKAAGDAEAARSIAALTRPNPVAFAVNQLAFDGKKELARLVEAGGELRRVQEALALGEEFAEAKRDHQKALRAAADRAVALAEAGDVATNAGFRRKLEMTLTVLSTAGKEGPRAGRLTSELEPTGFDALGALAEHAPPPPKTTPKESAKEKKAAAQAVERHEKDVERLEGELREAQQKKTETAKEAEVIERRAEAARKARDEARRDAERISSKLDEARNALTDRRRELGKLDS